MDCENCKGKTRVIDSRSYFGTMKRKRFCSLCRKSFITVEKKVGKLEREVLRAIFKRKKRLTSFL